MRIDRKTGASWRILPLAPIYQLPIGRLEIPILSPAFGDKISSSEKFYETTRLQEIAWIKN
jgi:hypothetical protein